MSIGESKGLVGQEFGNYRIEEDIAFGHGNGLYLAQDVVEGRPCFLAVVETPGTDDAGLAGDFRQRMETVARLEHPYIATVENLGATASGQPYAAIAYHEGTTLAERLAQLEATGAWMPVLDVLNLVGQIADALRVAHEAGIIHHDLRPENILIDRNNLPVLIDLGIPIGTSATITAEEMRRIGVLDYAAPEQLQGKSPSVQSNIYSLGILLYKLFTGRRPQIPRSSWDIFDSRPDELPRPVPLDDVRPGLAAETYHVVKNCLWREEWNRFESAAALIRAIERAKIAESKLEQQAISGRSYRKWALLALPVLLVIVLFVFLAIGGSGSDGEQTPTARPPTAVPGLATSSLSQIIEGLFTETPTITPTPTATATEEPTVSVALELLGPDPGSETNAGTEITFAWRSSTTPEPGQRYGVYLIVDDESELIGTATEPDEDGHYSVTATAGETLPIGTHFWQVVLEDADSGDTIASSRRRRLSVAPEATPTATATDTPEATETPTPTATATPTPVEECQVFQPFGWVIYTVRSGDALFSLATRTGTTAARLRQVNCLAGDILSIGQRIWVPVSPVTSTPVVPPTNTPGGSGPPPPPPPPDRPTPTPPVPPSP